MPQYRLTVDAPSITSLKAKLKKLNLSEDIQVEKVERPSSRGDRLSAAESDFENAKSVVAELREEMENWRDSLPENLKSGSKADEIEECIGQLEEIEGNMDSCDFSSVSFPGMY